MENQDTLLGVVERILFHNADNGFAVFVLEIKQNDRATVRGYLNNIQPGTQVHMTGSWVMHPKFGKQFEAQSCTAELPTNALGLKKYLGSGLIKGIGPVTADKL